MKKSTTNNNEEDLQTTTTTIATIETPTTTTNKDSKEDQDDDDDIIFSDLMENLIQEDVFNESNDRTGNYQQQKHEQRQQLRPQSARSSSSKTTITAKTSINEILLNQQPNELLSTTTTIQKTDNISNNRKTRNNNTPSSSSSLLEAVFEEDDDDDDEENDGGGGGQSPYEQKNGEEEDEGEESHSNDNNGGIKTDDQMSQMGFIIIKPTTTTVTVTNSENSQKYLNEKLKDTDIKPATMAILLDNVERQQINDGNQSLNGRNEMNKNPNDDEHQDDSVVDDDKVFKVDDDDYEEEFESESNSIEQNELKNNNINDLIQKSFDNEFQQRFQTITEQMQMDIVNLRENLRHELNESEKLLKKQITNEILLVNDRIDRIHIQTNNKQEKLSGKIDDLNLSITTIQKQQQQQTNIVEEIGNKIFTTKVNSIRNEVDENLNEKLQRISMNLDRTITNEIEKVSENIETKLLTKQEQMLRKELSLQISESMKQYENQMNHRLSLDRIRNEFRPFIDQCRLMSDENQKSIESLRSMIEQDRNFAQKNFQRIDMNLTRLLEKDKENSNMTALMNRSESASDCHQQQQQQIRDMITEERESLMKRLNELDTKIESFMQQIDSKLNRFETTTTTTIQGNSMSKETNPNNVYHNYNNDDDHHLRTFPITKCEQNSNSKLKKYHNNNDHLAHQDDNDEAISLDNNAATNIDSKQIPVTNDNNGTLVRSLNKNETNEKHLQLIEQCNNLKNFLQEFYVKNTDDGDDDKKMIKPPAKFNMARKMKTKNYNERRQQQRSNLEFKPKYRSMSNSNSSLQLSSSSSTASTSSKGHDHHHRRYRHRQGRDFIDTYILPNELMMNHHHHHRSNLPKKFDLNYKNQNQNKQAQHRVRMQTNSLISLIKQTTNQLKQELNNLDMLGDRSDDIDLHTLMAGRSSVNHHHDNDDLWLPLSSSLNGKTNRNINDDLFKFTARDDQQQQKNHDDQMLMLRMKSIRNSVNDRLMKISTAIEQQKITQI
uniref:Myb-like protein I isoform X1 n=1 Tax=Dermatophagoides pteronyssinus TaxID=6956 RepID=A0A6P6XSA6_DERPT|nr:myb-like protein I isoform X1 [Dermatophagoides pteronyssinus]